VTIVARRQPNLLQWSLHSTHADGSSSSASKLHVQQSADSSGSTSKRDDLLELQRCRMLVNGAKQLLK